MRAKLFESFLYTAILSFTSQNASDTQRQKRGEKAKTRTVQLLTYSVVA